MMLIIMIGFAILMIIAIIFTIFTPHEIDFLYPHYRKSDFHQLSDDEINELLKINDENKLKEPDTYLGNCKLFGTNNLEQHEIDHLLDSCPKNLISRNYTDGKRRQN